MIRITIGKEEVRQHKQFESDRYTLKVEQDVDDPNKTEQIIKDTFEVIRKQLEEQEAKDIRPKE